MKIVSATPRLLLAIFLVVAAVSAAAPQNPVLSRYRITPKNAAMMTEIAEKFEVIRREGSQFEVIVPRDKAVELKSLSSQTTLLESDLRDAIRRAHWTSGYHNFQTVQEELKTIVQNHPDLATLEQYGKSMEGRPLLALRLTGAQGPKKNEVMLTSATHGDELITVEVLLGLLQKLVSEYRTNQRVTKILDSVVVYFIPVVNPDGYVRQERYSNGVDPNREYPWPEKPERTPNPCIKGVIDFFHKHQMKGSIDFHASGELIMYPWAYTYSPVSNELHIPLDKVTSEMASHNGYQHGQISEVIYVAKGSSADYYLWKNNTLALGIEMALSKVPPTSQIPEILKDNTESTLLYLETISTLAR